MSKIVVIDSCSHCPYYDNYYPYHDKKCTLLNKVIEFGDPFPRDADEVDIQTNVYGTPPEECPLQNTEEDVLNKENIQRKYTKEITMRDETCIICGDKAAWIRVTQFSGVHPFCQKHAKEESDFHTEDDSYGFWEEIEEYE